MSPTSLTRTKRRRTTLTLAGDAPHYAVAVDHHHTEVPGPGGVSGHHGTQLMTGGEPAKRKQQVGSKLPSALPTAITYQHGQGGAQVNAVMPATNGRTAGQHTTELLPAVCHRPTYRADLAKRGYLVRNSLGCGSYSKVIITSQSIFVGIICSL